MKLNFRLAFIAVLMFLIFGCATKKTIDYNSAMEESGTVELDADFNGATDVSKGGTNVQSYSALKTVLSLDEVDNTSDLDKPVSDLTQTAIDTKADQTDLDATNTNVGNKEDTLPIAVEDVSFLTTLVDTTRSFLSIAQTKIALSLNLVDNTPDTDKPISTLTQNALDLKADQTELDTTNTAVELNTAKVTEQDIGANTGDQVGDGVTITGVGTVGDPFVAVGGGSMVYPGAGIPLSTGSAWGTSYTSTTLAQLLYGEDWDFSAAVDMRNASSFTVGPTQYGLSAVLPGSVEPGDIYKEFLMSGITGFNDGNVASLWDGTNNLYQFWTFGLPTALGDHSAYNPVTDRFEIFPASSGATVTEVADTPEAWEMTPNQIYQQVDNGQLSILLTDSSEVFRYAATSSTSLYDLTLAVVSDGTITINGTGYTSSGSPHTVTALEGTVDITGAYGGSNDTLTWTGDTVTGTYPNYQIAMGTADKSITGTFSEAAPADGFVGLSGAPSFTNSAPTSGADEVSYSIFTCSQAGAVNYIDVYLAGASSTEYNVAIYSADGNTLLADSTGTSSSGAGYLKFQLDSEVTLVDATDYRLSIGQVDAAGTSLDAGFSTSSGEDWFYNISATVTTTTMPSTMTGTTPVQNNYQLNINANNTAP